jgi:hypothetical protein
MCAVWSHTWLVKVAISLVSMQSTKEPHLKPSCSAWKKVLPSSSVLHGSSEEPGETEFHLLTVVTSSRRHLCLVFSAFSVILHSVLSTGINPLFQSLSQVGFLGVGMGSGDDRLLTPSLCYSSQASALLIRVRMSRSGACMLLPAEQT